MTEEEWFAWDNPRLLLEGNSWRPSGVVSAAFTTRRLRLFAVACCRRVQGIWWDSRLIAAVDAAEKSVDARGAVKRWLVPETRQALSKAGAWLITLEGQLAQAVIAKGALDAATGCCFYSSVLVGGDEECRYNERIAQGPLLRDVVGNPFRPVAFFPEWRTSTAVAIAQGMYESRDFSAMPILADALQDAGCDNDDVLNHCRDANGVHVRGCWVVDHVLGKS